jgi:hypothetical protein
MPQGQFFACRVLSSKPDRLDFVVFQESEITRRNDVEMSSKGFATEAEAESEINNLGGVIPTGDFDFLDFWEGDTGTVWCWKDDRTCGASQVFGSEEEALEAWRAGVLVFDALLD